MLKISENGKYIDIKSLPNSFEIPIEKLFNYSQINSYIKENYEKNKLFTYEEIDINDSSGAIKYKRGGDSLLVNIYGPKECKYREKLKNECCIIEIFSKFNKETKIESK